MKSRPLQRYQQCCLNDERGDVPVKPDKALCGGVLLLLELVEDKVLEGL